jgi:dephospho-CoA kinase
VRSIICLSGSIASGKSTVSHALAEMWPNAETLSFGDVVRTRTRLEGLPSDRATLQEVGSQLLAEGWQSFITALIAGVSTDTVLLIVDGIRHPAAIDSLYERFPGATIRTVFLRVDEEVAARRMMERGESPTARGHAIESELVAVERRADLVISGALPVETTVRVISGLVTEVSDGPRL